MKHMSRLSLSLAGALLLAAPAMAQTKWNLPTAYPTDNFHTQNNSQFAKDVQDATGGKLQITVHPNASLFKAPEIKRAVQTGQAQLGEVPISLHENEAPVFGVDNVPFLATSYGDARKLWEVSKLALEKKLASQGLILLYAVPWPPQSLFTKKEINRVEDLKGEKWRAQTVGFARIAELVGAQPVTVQAAELPQALATGVVTAFISSAATGVDIKVWETMTHFYDIQASVGKNMVFVNKAAFDALDKSTRQSVLQAASAAQERGWAMSEQKTKEFVEQLATRGMKVLPPTPELQAGFQKIGEQLLHDWLKRAGAEGEEIVNAYRGK